MRRYETIFILRPSLSEKEIDDIIENTSNLINKDDGSIIDLDRWGMRKLAYLIKKENQGYYVLMDYCTSPQTVAEMERKFRIDDSVLKYMTVKVVDSIKEEEIDAVKQAVEEEKAAKKAAEEAALAEKSEKDGNQPVSETKDGDKSDSESEISTDKETNETE